MGTPTEPGDDVSDSHDYSLTITRDSGEWVGRLTGPYLPADGLAARSDTLPGLNLEILELYPRAEIRAAQGSPGGDYGTNIDYDFGPAVNQSRAGFRDARLARNAAARGYWQDGHDAAVALTGEHGATIEETASIMGISRWEASQLLAFRGMPQQLVHFHYPGVRHWMRGHAWPALRYAAPFAIRQGRILAADALRGARKQT